MDMVPLIHSMLLLLPPPQHMAVQHAFRQGKWVVHTNTIFLKGTLLLLLLYISSMAPGQGLGEAGAYQRNSIASSCCMNAGMHGMKAPQHLARG